MNAVILGDAFSCRFDLLRLAEAVQHHVRTCAGERASDAKSDAAGRAGDQRDFALERGATAAFGSVIAMFMAL